MKRDTFSILLDKDGSNNLGLTISKITYSFLRESLCQYGTAAKSNSSNVKLRK